MRRYLEIVLLFALHCAMDDIMVSGKKILQEECVDEKSALKCGFWKRHGSCVSHQKRMMDFCAKTCNLCEVKRLCKSVNCPSPKFCKLNSRGEPYCGCSLECRLKSLKKKLGAVCATDGNTYINICKMQFTACEQSRSIAVKKFGQCAVQGPCEDKQKRKLCLGWKAAGACKVYVPLMKRYCMKTCNMCEKRAAAPFPDCKNTVYGCCPDNVTTALGPNGKGCTLICADKYRFCEAFTTDCKSRNSNNRKFMKKHCRKSCGYCTNEG